MSLSDIDPHKLQTQRTQHYSALKFGPRASVTQPLAQHDDSISYPIGQERDTPTSPVVLFDYCISSTLLSTTKLANLTTVWLCSSIPSLTTFNISHNSVTHLMDQGMFVHLV